MEFRQSSPDEPPAPLPPPPPLHFWLDPPTPPQPQSSCDVFTEQRATRASCRIPPGFGLGNDYLSQGIGHNVNYIGQGVGRVNEKFEMINNVHPEIQRYPDNETTKTSCINPEYGIGCNVEYFGKGTGKANGNVGMFNNVDPDIQRAFEKQKIREEIIAEEMARRRELEAEVREELRVERELALRIKGGNAFESVHVTMEPSGKSLAQEVEGLSLEEKVDETSQEMEKINFLAKPSAESAYLSATQREAFIPPKESTAYTVFGVWGVRNIEGRKEWRCFICQVSANSETDLKHHFNGNKHRSKRAALQAEKGAATIVPQIGVKAVHLSRREPLLPTPSPTVSAKPLDGNNVLPVLPENKNKAKGKEKFTFWCEMCNAGANNKYVMEAHKKGKKHLEKLQKKFPFWCDLCKVGAERAHIMEAHPKGKKHLNTLQEKAAS